MRKLLLAAAACASVCAWADTAYPVSADTAEANLKKVSAFKENAYWKTAPFAVAAVDPVAGVRRTPDAFPEDGDFTGPVRALLAKGEYEGASFVLYGFDDVDEVHAKVNVPGVEADVKIVKVWYQSGTSWGSFFSDHTRRVATPEIMVHDDAVLFIDHKDKENYVRCDYSKGNTAYRWISFEGRAVDHTYHGELNTGWIHDADQLKPFKLFKGEFKQLIVTFHAPANAQPGLKKGSIALTVKGRKVCDVPAEVKVLPFELPLPAMFRDLNRRFFAAPYGGFGGYDPGSEKKMRNMVAHNVRNCLLPSITTPSEAKKAYDMFKRCGFDTEHLFTALPGCGITTSYPAKETDGNYANFVNATNTYAKAMDAIREVFGPTVKAYSYGVDEGSAWTVRAERSTWKGVHQAGGNTIVATQWHPFILFNLDFANVPRHPRAAKRKNADAYHDGNPDGIMGWYADPHSGPENPDYTRRIYGWQTWRNNYDASCQYILARNNWNDFWIPAEAFLRGLMLVYPQAGDFLDTIEWEGLREGMDDVRYGTLLKQLGQKCNQSKNMDTVYAGRSALTWVAQVDCERSELKYLRYEMTRRILDLQERLAKEGK